MLKLKNKINLRIFLSLIAVLSLSISACTSQTKNPIITTHGELDRYIGQSITIQGRVSNTKIPTIIGVDIQSDDPNLRDQQAQATGILQKWVVTSEQLENTNQMIANRGPGTFYRLKNPQSNHTAQAESITP